MNVYHDFDGGVSVDLDLYTGSIGLVDLDCLDLIPPTAFVVRCEDISRAVFCDFDFPVFSSFSSCLSDFLTAFAHQVFIK